MCNIKRGILTEEVFDAHVLDMCKKLDITIPAELPSVRTYHDAGSYGRGRSPEAAGRKLDELPKEVRASFKGQPCSMCTVNPATGVDRIDNARHYTEDNSQPACKVCNYIKLDWPMIKLKEWLACVGWVVLNRKREGKKRSIEKGEILVVLLLEHL